jgi:hypothetical protein
VISSSDPGEHTPPSPRLEPLTTWLLAGVLVVIPVYTAALGRYSRPIADDFCTAGWLQRLGFLGSQAYWYQQWSGRFSFSFLMTTSQLAGLSLTPWMPILHLAGLFGALYWTAGQLARAFQWHLRAAERALAAATVVAWTVAAVPNVYQSFLWHTGLVTYALSLILEVLIIGWFARITRTELADGIRIKGGLLVPFGLAFIAGGLSETYVALQTLGLGLALLLIALRKGKSHRVFLPASAALMGSLGAAFIVLAAPGNRVRQGLLATPRPWLQVLNDSFYNAYLFAAQVKSHQLGWLALALAVSFTIGWSLGHTLSGQAGRGDGTIRSLGWALAGLVVAPFVVFIAIATAMAPSAYALGSYPDGRVLLLAQFQLSSSVVLWGCAVGRLGSSWVGRRRLSGWSVRLAPVGRLLLLAPGALLVLGFVRTTAPLAADAQQFASRWDNRDRALRSAAVPNTPIEAASLAHLGGLAELERDPDSWINRCLAMAYGLPSVVAK